MIVFNGKYTSKVDDKNRFLMPAAVKKQMPEEKCEFMICEGKDKNLYLFPLQVWRQKQEDLLKVGRNDKKVRLYLTLSLGGATEVGLDNAGRMLMPGHLKQYAGISKDIMITAELDRFIIWDTAYYNKFFEGKSIDEMLSIMGGSAIDELSDYIAEKYGIIF